jgi:excisionase family DNA binding protein
MSRLKTIPEAASYTGLSERFLRTLVFERRITFHKLGRRVYFAPEDLDAFVEAGRVEAKRDSYLEGVTPLARRPKAEVKRAARGGGG